MGSLELSPTAQHWVNLILIWIGFGTIAGLLARILVPGRDPGVVGTVVIGVLGSTVGPLALVTALGRDRFNPIGPTGLMAATGGAAVLLLVYRLLAVLAAGSRKGESRGS